jgi:leucyl aminopeptidase
VHPIFVKSGAAPGTLPIWFVNPANYAEVRERLGGANLAFADAAGFKPKAGRHLLLPEAKGQGLGAVLFGLEDAGEPGDPFLPGLLPQLLPAGAYRFANDPYDARLAALSFALGAYAFSRYRKVERGEVMLDPPQGVDRGELERVVEGVTLARNLINTPANDMGPAELEEAARALAARHGAKMRTIVGDDLLTEKFPLLHAVGRGSPRAPRLIELTWGEPDHPRVTLVGKGVCFDSGGLDIKSESAMSLMKKDMGGAASALALAHMVMARGLKIRLGVLIPAVENSIDGEAFRPGDIYVSGKGLSVEIGNTDAEGRLVLADALAWADESAPDLLVDLGTLTGAARVALGPDLPPFYTEDDTFAADLSRHGFAENDPMWRLPLWAPYNALLESKVADVNNVSSRGFAGSITCALFLKRFVSVAKTWVHVDIYAWTPIAKPGRPEGGECQAARALYALLAERYG